MRYFFALVYLFVLFSCAALVKYAGSHRNKTIDYFFVPDFYDTLFIIPNGKEVKLQNQGLMIRPMLGFFDGLTCYDWLENTFSKCRKKIYHVKRGGRRESREVYFLNMTAPILTYTKKPDLKSKSPYTFMPAGFSYDHPNKRNFMIVRRFRQVTKSSIYIEGPSTGLILRTSSAYVELYMKSGREIRFFNVKRDFFSLQIDHKLTLRISHGRLVLMESAPSEKLVVFYEPRNSKSASYMSYSKHNVAQYLNNFIFAEFEDFLRFDGKTPVKIEIRLRQRNVLTESFFMYAPSCKGTTEVFLKNDGANELENPDTFKFGFLLQNNVQYHYLYRKDDINSPGLTGRQRYFLQCLPEKVSLLYWLYPIGTQIDKRNFDFEVIPNLVSLNVKVFSAGYLKLSISSSLEANEVDRKKPILFMSGRKEAERYKMLKDCSVILLGDVENRHNFNSVVNRYAHFDDNQPSKYPYFECQFDPVTRETLLEAYFFRIQVVNNHNQTIFDIQDPVNVKLVCDGVDCKYEIMDTS